MVKYQERAKTCHWGHVMAWVVLVLFGICEAVWAVALDKSQGFTKYLIWVGIGAAITVVYGMVVGEESVSVLKILCLIGMAACIAGLKLAG